MFRLKVFVRVRGPPCPRTTSATLVPVIQEVDCSSDECAPNCAPGWEEFNGRCYFWSQEKLFWGEAEQRCRGFGGHLASVTSQEEQDYLQHNVSGLNARKKTSKEYYRASIFHISFDLREKMLDLSGLEPQTM